MDTLSPTLKTEIRKVVALARAESPINVVKLAELVQSQNPSENVAYEDILSWVLVVAQTTGEPIMFERPELPSEQQIAFAAKPASTSLR